MEFEQVVCKRRMVRHFSDEPVEKENRSRQAIPVSEARPQALRNHGSLGNLVTNKENLEPDFECLNLKWRDREL